MPNTMYSHFLSTLTRGPRSRPRRSRSYRPEPTPRIRWYS